MGKRKKRNKRKKRRLRKLLKACDPEISILCLLIVQAQVADFPFFGGEIQRTYADHRDKLIAQAELTTEQEEAWKKGKWKTFVKLLKGDVGLEGLPTELPTARGWPP